MKNINLVLKIMSVIVLFTPNNLVPGYEGRQAARESNLQEALTRVGRTMTLVSPSTAGGSGGCCSTGQSCQTTNANTFYIPSFNVYIIGSDGSSILNTPGKTLLPASANNTSFTHNNSILTVNIFPPSNVVGTTNQFPENKQYLIFYTLKTMDGSTIYTDYETFTSTATPHFIGINPASAAAPSTTTTPAPATFVVTGAPSDYAFYAQFLPVKNFPIGINPKWQALNGITPISQNFLFSLDSSGTTGQITVYQISGMSDAGNFQGDQSHTFSAFSSKLLTTDSDGLGTLNISLDGASNNISFEQNSKIPFSTTDLQNSLILNIVITLGINGSTYNVAATLRTTDGNKMRKKSLLSTSSNALSSIPTSITISQNSTVILTTNFLNANNVSSGNGTNLSNMVLPLNLRFSISQPAGQPIQVLML